MGISSMAAATSAVLTSIPSRREDRTTKSDTGSPISAAPVDPGRGCSSISAPIRIRRSTMARRVGFVPTPRSVRSASGWMAAATSQKAAADGSPGTCSSIAATAEPPSISTTAPVAPSIQLRTAMPRARSMRSVWSRVATASWTLVVPLALSPASRIADFTWADGTGVLQSIERSSARPPMVTGGSASPSRAEIRAPIARSGSMIRATGRRRSESSPSSVAPTPAPARSPTIRRSVVPELPQSRTPPGGMIPATPGDSTR